MIWRSKETGFPSFIHSFNKHCGMTDLFRSREIRKSSWERGSAILVRWQTLQRACCLVAKAALTCLHLPHSVFFLTVSPIKLSTPGGLGSSSLFTFPPTMPQPCMPAQLASARQRPTLSKSLCLILQDCSLFLDLKDVPWSELLIYVLCTE